MMTNTSIELYQKLICFVSDPLVYFEDFSNDSLFCQQFRFEVYL